MKLSFLLVALQLLPGSVTAVRNLQFASPLQALTIWDSKPSDDDADSSKLTTARSRFLPQFKAGLAAETQARQTLASKRHEQLQIDATSSDDKDWSDKAAAAEDQIRLQEERILETSFDKAVNPIKMKQQAQLSRASASSSSSSSKYQFVGVIGRPNDPQDKAITWYARKKPANSKWSVRLVHVNRDAIVKDLFDQGKVDIFGKYSNTGTNNPETGLPVIQSQYTARKRSWKNLWNFSPKHFFSDSSGMYWRERRLRPGLYTDGKAVYESSYRYRDGRNGMHRRSSLAQFLSSPAIDGKTKQRALQRLKKESPDVVLEE